MEQPIGLGFVGAGAIARGRHIPGFRALPGIELVSVATRSADSAQRAQAEHGFGRSVSDWRGVIEDPDVDAVIVATWPDLHGAVTIAALEAGKHVLTQARMARDADEAWRMLAVSLAHPELVTAVAPSAFSLRADTTIAEQVADGGIGQVRTAR